MAAKIREQKNQSLIKEKEFDILMKLLREKLVKKQ